MLIQTEKRMKMDFFCPFSRHRFPMIPRDSHAPHRISCSHTMSQHPTKRVESYSERFLRNRGSRDPYFAYFYYKKINFWQTSEHRFPMIPRDSHAPHRISCSHTMSQHPTKRVESYSERFLRNWGSRDPYFACFYNKKNWFSYSISGLDRDQWLALGHPWAPSGLALGHPRASSGTLMLSI